MKKFILTILVCFGWLISQAVDSVTFKEIEYIGGQMYYGNPPTIIASDPNISFAFISESGRNVKFYSPTFEELRSITLDLPDGYSINYVIQNEIHELVVASQYLFNDDDDFEIFVQDNNGDLWVYSESGKQLFKCPTSSFVIRNGVFYFYYGNHGDSGIHKLYYVNKIDDTLKVDLLNRDSNKLNIGITKELILINIPDNTPSKSIIAIFSIDGKLLFREAIEANVKEVKVSSYKLTEGVNLIVLIDENGEIIGTGKAIKK